LIFHFAWQEQIFVEAADAEEPGAVGHDAKGLDIEKPDALELDKEPNAMESDTGLVVLCCNLLVWALLS
jgi:hypothetical protein